MSVPFFATARTVSRRLSNSFAFRSGLLYRQALRMLPVPRLPSKPALELPLLTACGRRHLPMLEQALYSMAVSWSRLPAITVVSDGTAPLEEIARRLRWWPNGLEVKPWQAYADYHRERGRSALARYAENDGFGRKLAAILALSESRRMLWCDCDILFYSDFTPYLSLDLPPAPFIVATQDWVNGYDSELVAKLRPHLLERPFVNTGLAIFEGNLYDTCGLEPLIEQASVSCNVFTEQTILAEAVYHRGKIVWGLDVIRIFDDDILTLKPTFLSEQWMARHYITPVRHLFWRDALAFRLGAR